MIFPEAATTNGTGLINFKKGPFISLQSVQPYVINYKSYGVARPQHGDATHWHYWLVYTMHCGWVNAVMKELPVF